MKDRENRFLDSAEISALLAALDAPEADVRITMLEALTRLPLAPADWVRVGAFAEHALQSSDSEEERLAVVDLAPWIPLHSTREEVKRLAAESEDESLRTRAEQAVAAFDRPPVSTDTDQGAPLEPAWARGKPPGFTFYPPSERTKVNAELATLERPLTAVELRELEAHIPDAPGWGFSLDDRTMTRILERGLAAAAVTLLFGRARSEGVGVFFGNFIVGWVQGVEGRFRPDLHGLFDEYWRTALAECERWGDETRIGSWFLRSTDFEAWRGYRSLCWQIGWTVSRGGLRGLVPGLAPHLGATDASERIAAALLIADAADYALQADAPVLGGGSGPEHALPGELLPGPMHSGATWTTQSRGDDLEVASGTPSVLAEMLREAALDGVVPATAQVPLPAAAAPAAYPSVPAPPYVDPPEGWQATPTRSPPQMRRSPRLPRTSVGLLRLAAAAVVLVGGTLVAARWLFGWFVEPSEEPEDALDEVECTVFAPPAAAPGDSILVQAFVHLPEDADHARAIATELDVDAQRRAFRSLECPVRVSSRIQLELRMPGLEVDDPVAALVWRRRTEAVQFGVHVPPSTPARTVIGTLAVSVDSAPSGYVKFKLAIQTGVAPRPSEPQGERAGRYTAAFISYASKDRDQALEAAQLLRGVGIRYFQDVLNLEPGDRWLKKVELGIDECDLFLLCWSRAAKGSEWVRKEVQYALARQAGDELALPDIQPLILEGPPPVLPWEELEHLHFNEPLLYFRSRPRGAP